VTATAVLAQAQVVERSSPMHDAVELVLHEETAAGSVRPGQFFQLAVDAPHTLLRRPYSVAWMDRMRGRVAFLFSVVGAGSAWLADREAGDRVDLLGPLGTGFAVSQSGRPAVLVAGGLGIAAFPALVQALNEAQRPVVVLQGARTASRLLPTAWLPRASVREATDDGTRGHQGPVTDLLPPALREETEIFACGPTPMLQAMVRVLTSHGFPLSRVQVSLETPMGCGMGTCLGCAAPATGGGYLLTCRDGPCMTADRIDWDQMPDAFHG
jgi:dihydroorotate dehydrogenase electron transfer subunit